MSTTDNLALIGTIVVVIVPLAGLIWYIINHRSEWKKISLAGVVTVLIMAALLAGVSAAASHYAPSTPSPNPLSQGTVGAISPSSRGVTPTPTPEVIPINQTMICTNCSGSDNYSLIVKTATIEPDKNQITLLVGLQNNTSASGNMWFNYLKLQDMQTSDTYNGVGDGIDWAHGFWISSNHLQLFRFSFPFLPVAGYTYSLSVLLRDSLNLSPITIKF